MKAPVLLVGLARVTTSPKQKSKRGERREQSRNPETTDRDTRKRCSVPAAKR